MYKKVETVIPIPLTLYTLTPPHLLCPNNLMASRIILAMLKIAFNYPSRNKTFPLILTTPITKQKNDGITYPTKLNLFGILNKNFQGDTP